MFRKYSQQQKSAILRQLKDRSIPIVQMAEELGVSRSTLHRWVREAEEMELDPTDISRADLVREVQALQQENEQLRQEVTVLKQIASLYFSNGPAKPWHS